MLLLNDSNLYNDYNLILWLSIRNFMYIKHNGDNAKLRMFSFIPQQQCIQPNFMTNSIQTFIHTKHQTTKHTNTIWQPKQRHQSRLQLYHKVYALTTEIMHILECSYSNFSINWKHKQLYQRLFVQRYNVIICTWLAYFADSFLHFIHHQFCTLHWSLKTCTWLTEQFRAFHPLLYESVTNFTLFISLTETITVLTEKKAKYWLKCITVAFYRILVVKFSKSIFSKTYHIRYQTKENLALICFTKSN